MENKKILIITGVVSLFTFGLAALWHFIFAIAPSNFMALIFPLNESPWEHVKLLFFPAILGYAVLYFIYVFRKTN